MNHNIRKVLEAVELLRDVQGCDLEVASLSHKIQAMYSQGKEGLKGIEFIDACTDDELIAALFQQDPRTNIWPHVCPFTFAYLRKNRPICLCESERLRGII